MKPQGWQMYSVKSWNLIVHDKINLPGYNMHSVTWNIITQACVYSGFRKTISNVKSILYVETEHDGSKVEEDEF